MFINFWLLFSFFNRFQKSKNRIYDLLLTYSYSLFKIIWVLFIYCKHCCNMPVQEQKTHWEKSTIFHFDINRHQSICTHILDTFCSAGETDLTIFLYWLLQSLVKMGNIVHLANIFFLVLIFYPHLTSYVNFSHAWKDWMFTFQSTRPQITQDCFIYFILKL